TRTNGESGRADASERLDEVLGRYFEALEARQAPDPDQLLARHPELADELREFFRDQQWADRWTGPLQSVARALQPPPDAKATCPLTVGQRVGDCELLAEVGRGGMGVVFRARQTSLNRDVALKMILAGPFASGGEVQRFRREAEAAA